MLWLLSDSGQVIFYVTHVQGGSQERSSRTEGMLSEHVYVCHVDINVLAYLLCWETPAAHSHKERTGPWHLQKQRFWFG